MNLMPGTWEQAYPTAIIWFFLDVELSGVCVLRFSQRLGTIFCENG